MTNPLQPATWPRKHRPIYGQPLNQSRISSKTHVHWPGITLTANHGEAMGPISSSVLHTSLRLWYLKDQHLMLPRRCSRRARHVTGDRFYFAVHKAHLTPQRPTATGDLVTTRWKAFATELRRGRQSIPIGTPLLQTFQPRMFPL